MKRKYTRLMVKHYNDLIPSSGVKVVRLGPMVKEIVERDSGTGFDILDGKDRWQFIPNGNIVNAMYELVETDQSDDKKLPARTKARGRSKLVA